MSEGMESNEEKVAFERHSEQGLSNGDRKLFML